MAARGETGGRDDVRLTLTVEEAAKKLVLWHTATFRPILTHADLEPILKAAGFVALPWASKKDQEQPEAATTATVAWREYAFLGSSGRRNAAATSGWTGPRPRLPYPRLDALHLRTYEDFLAAVEVYLGALRMSDLFHIRCMKVSTKEDGEFDKVFRAMRNEQVGVGGVIVYRSDTLDAAADDGEHATGAADDGGLHVIPGKCSSLSRYIKHGRIHGGGDGGEETACDHDDGGGGGGIDVIRLDYLSPSSDPAQRHACRRSS